MRRPIGIFEWCALTQEMLDVVYPESMFPKGYGDGWDDHIRHCLKDVLLIMPDDALERGEATLRQEQKT